MSNNEIAARVAAILADVLDLDVGDVGAKTSMETVAEWTSLDHLTVILALEEEFDLSFGDDEVPVLVSYPAIVETVAARKAE
jgi:acyl carrier protein